jgi:hypothetical protein
MVVFVDSSTNMNDERVFLVDQSGGGNHSESEMKLNIYVPIINVGTLMSIGNDRQ